MFAGGSGTAIVEVTRSCGSTWISSPDSSSRQSGLVSMRLRGDHGRGQDRQLAGEHARDARAAALVEASARAPSARPRPARRSTARGPTARWCRDSAAPTRRSAWSAACSASRAGSPPRSRARPAAMPAATSPPCSSIRLVISVKYSSESVLALHERGVLAEALAQRVELRPARRCERTAGRAARTDGCSRSVGSPAVA